MSAIRTFTVTVANPGSGNKYYIDGVLQATINLAEGYTYVFNYPSAHPFRFSTTSDGTHSGGTEYTTGVTHNSSTQTTIVVADSAPQLYYYCSIHSGMGGQANTVDADTWGVLQWGQNTWSSQDDVVITLTGQSATTTLGTPSAFNETGWGADTWGFEGWGGAETKLALTALPTLTASVGSLTPAVKPGWGTLNWGQNGWGSVEAAQFSLTGFSLTSSLGTVVAEDVVGLSGFSLTSTVNSFADVSTDATITLTGLGLISTEGLLVPGDHSVGLSGFSLTSTLGTATTQDAVGLTGFSLSANLGTVAITSDPVHILPTPTGLTASLGTVEALPVTVATLSGQSLTSALGTVTTVQQTNASLVGLGLSATVTLGTAGISFPGTYARIVPKTSTGYTKINPV